MRPALFLLSAAAIFSLAGTAFAEPPDALARIPLSTLPEAPAHPPPADAKPAKVAGSLEINSAAPAPPRTDMMDEGGIGLTPWMTQAPAGVCVAPDPQSAGFLRMEHVLPPRDAQATSLLEVRHVKVLTSALTGVELIPLALVASSGSELVYAYRDEDAVHLIWTLPDTPRNVRWSDARSHFNAANCGHAHLVLSIRDANGPKSSAFGAAPLRFAPSLDKPAPPREIKLSASVSQSSHDREPLVSVALAYGDGDSRDRFTSRAPLQRMMRPDERILLE